MYAVLELNCLTLNFLPNMPHTEFLVFMEQNLVT
jgi:hypothetical protein